ENGERDEHAELELQDRHDVLAFELLPAAELDELDEERKSDNSSAESLDEFGRRASRSSRREQVVHDENALTAFDRVCMDLGRVALIIENVARANRGIRQLARLPNR